jgi:hypothetical protein
MERHYAPKMGKGLRKQPIGIIENVGAQLVCLKTTQMRQDYPRPASDAKKEGGSGKQPGGGSKKYQAHWSPIWRSFGRALLVGAEGQLSPGGVRCREDEGQAISL